MYYSLLRQQIPSSFTVRYSLRTVSSIFRLQSSINKARIPIVCLAFTAWHLVIGIHHSTVVCVCCLRYSVPYLLFNLAGNTEKISKINSLWRICAKYIGVYLYIIKNFLLICEDSVSIILHLPIRSIWSKI